MSQSWLPADACGHSTTQLAPGGHSVWHGPLSHVNRQLESGAQRQVPLAQVPSHCTWSPSQSTWQGGAPHSNAQRAPRSQRHIPLAQVASQRAPLSQVTLHGGASQVSSQSWCAGQVQARFEQSRSLRPQPTKQPTQTTTAPTSARIHTGPSWRRALLSGHGAAMKPDGHPHLFLASTPQSRQARIEHGARRSRAENRP
jgi:hypothetical protein